MVIPRVFDRAEAHALLVALAGDDDQVARLRHLHGEADGHGAVGDGHVALALAAAGLLQTDGNIVHDGGDVLGARVFGRDDREIGQATGDLAHHRALGVVAQAGAAEDDDHAPLRHGARSGQGALEGVGRVGKVHDGREVLPLVNALHAPRDVGHCCQAALDGGNGQAEGDAGADRRQRVGDIVAAGLRDLDREAAGGRDGGEVLALGALR